MSQCAKCINTRTLFKLLYLNKASVAVSFNNSSVKRIIIFSG